MAAEVMSKKRKPRSYTLRDLIDIAQQMHGRLRLECVPMEMLGGPSKPNPALPIKPTARKRRPKS
jgi:hypothetical protein